MRKRFFQFLLLLATLAWCAPAHAQIAFDAVSNSSASDGSSVTSITWSHTVTSNTNGVLTVGCGFSTVVGATISGITYNGVALTNAVVEDGDPPEKSDMWYLKVPATGANNVVVTFSGTVVTTICVAISMTGVDQTNPIDAVAENNETNAGTFTIQQASITTVAADAWIVDLMYNSNAGRTVTMDAQTGRTLRSNSDDDTGGSKSVASTWGPVSAGAHTVGWTTNFAVAWSMSVVSFKPAAGAAPARRRVVIF